MRLHGSCHIGAERKLVPLGSLTALASNHRNTLSYIEPYRCQLIDLDAQGHTRSFADLVLMLPMMPMMPMLKLKRTIASKRACYLKSLTIVEFLGIELFFDDGFEGLSMTLAVRG